MKKRIITMLVLLCAAACLLSLAACKNDEPITLSPPTGLKVNDEEILTWDKVDGASLYLVEIDDKSYETATNSLDILTYTLEYKTYEIKVTAYGDLDNYLDSKPSKVLKYTVSAVSGLKLMLINNGEAYKVVGFDKTQSGKLIIPARYDGKKIIELSTSCLSFCDKLTSVVLPDTVEEIGISAFNGCKNLKRIRLPYYLQSLGNVVFEGCSSLNQITLPPFIENIGLGIFQGCDSLTQISMIEDLDYPYKVENNCLIRRRDNALIAGCRTSVIPDYVKTIEYFAFGHLKNLKQITIPERVETIEQGAFWKTGLTQIYIPSRVKSIKEEAFYGCEDLKEVVFSEGLELIGKEADDVGYGDYLSNAFGGCTSLKSIFLPASLTHIDGSTFSECSNLEELTISPENETYKVDGNCLIRKEDDCLVIYGGKVNTIPDYVKKIGIYAFYSRDLIEMELPSGLTEIGSYAFYNNDFSQITLPENLKEIGFCAFKSCEKLKSIAIPSSVESIGSSAFEDCHALSVILPGTVKIIGANAFDAASIYTSAPSIQMRPEGWEYTLRECKSDIWASVSCTVFWGCKFGYNSNQPYVESWECVKDDDRFTIKFGNGDVIKGYIPVPMRSGYQFVGWATEEGSTEVVYPVTLVDPSTFVYPDYVLPEDRYFGEAFYSCLSLKEIALMPSGTTLYAVWQPISE